MKSGLVLKPIFSFLIGKVPDFIKNILCWSSEGESCKMITQEAPESHSSLDIPNSQLLMEQFPLKETQKLAERLLHL